MIGGPPRVGWVLRYAYLWARESATGAEEGRKDRPCALIAATRTVDGVTTAYVLPITHARPDDATGAVELPAGVKAHLGLDGERSWVVLDEYNRFSWPGPDLRPALAEGEPDIYFGPLPPRLFDRIRSEWRTRLVAQRAKAVRRPE